MTPEDIQIINLSGDVKLLEEQLAAATARAEAAERDAADVRRWADAVPVEELRRYYFHSIAFVDPDSSYTDTDAAADCFAIGAWLVRQAVQP